MQDMPLGLLTSLTCTELDQVLFNRSLSLAANFFMVKISSNFVFSFC